MMFTSVSHHLSKLTGGLETTLFTVRRETIQLLVGWEMMFFTVAMGVTHTTTVVETVMTRSRKA
ncbi:hypothetical protein OA90_27300 [Labrenzia sp. OB1]|nr:hypothetical protein OA90_27300 [Labrenzia sp. OB1]